MLVQCEAYIPWLLLYMGRKLNLSIISEEDGITKKIGVAFSRVQMHRFIVAMASLLITLFPAYGYLALMRGWKLNNFIDSFTATDPAYHGDPSLWFFASNRTVIDQLKFVYDGYISIFICRYPDFLTVMPQATLLGGFLAIPIFYLLLSSFSINLKTLCALQLLSYFCFMLRF